MMFSILDMPYPLHGTSASWITKFMILSNTSFTFLEAKGQYNLQCQWLKKTKNLENTPTWRSGGPRACPHHQVKKRTHAHKTPDQGNPQTPWEKREEWDKTEPGPNYLRFQIHLITNLSTWKIIHALPIRSTRLVKFMKESSLRNHASIMCLSILTQIAFRNKKCIYPILDI